MKYAPGRMAAKKTRIDQSPGLRIQRDVQADDVGGGSHLHGRVHALHAELTRGVGGQAAAPRHHGQAEGFGAQGDFAADLSEADQSERAAEEAARLGEAALVPLALAQRDHVVGDLAVERENQAEGEFGHGDGVLAGAVGDVDAAARGGRHIDGVVARAGAHHQFERAGGEHRLRHFGAAHHQDVGAELLHVGDQRLVLEFGREADFAAQAGEFVAPGLLELVGDQYAHGIRPGTRRRATS